MYRISFDSNLRQILHNAKYANFKPSYRFLTDDHYRTLDLNRSATNKEIKTAYYNLSKKFHPDVNKETNAEAKFKEIQAAYHVLGDDERKQTYDRILDDNSSSGSTRGSSGRYQNADYSAYSNVNVNIRQNKWKQRSGKVYTGRTNAYDFDEYYRMHYEDMIKRRHQELRQEEELRKKWAEYKQTTEDTPETKLIKTHIRSIRWFLICTFCVTFYLFIEQLKDGERRMNELRARKAVSK